MYGRAKTAFRRERRLVDRLFPYLSATLVLLPTGAFIGLVAQPIGRWWAPAGWAIAGVTGLLLLIALASLFTTAWCDPGIVPPAALPSREPPPEPLPLLINGITYRLRYCSQCGIWRPPRAAHCRMTDACVEKFDHWCPWVGNAIGRRNYRSFLVLLASFCCLEGWVLGWSVAALAIDTDRHDRSLGESIKHMPQTMVLIGFCACTAWFPAVLLVFHSYLISHNLTTYERYKLGRMPRAERINYIENQPFDQGLCRNIGTVLCPTSCPGAEVLAVQKRPSGVTTLSDAEEARGPGWELPEGRPGLGVGSQTRAAAPGYGGYGEQVRGWLSQAPAEPAGAPESRWGAAPAAPAAAGAALGARAASYHTAGGYPPYRRSPESRTVEMRALESSDMAEEGAEIGHEPQPRPGWFHHGRSPFDAGGGAQLGAVSALGSASVPRLATMDGMGAGLGDPWVLSSPLGSGLGRGGTGAARGARTAPRPRRPPPLSVASPRGEPDDIEGTSRFHFQLQQLEEAASALKRAEQGRPGPGRASDLPAPSAGSVAGRQSTEVGHKNLSPLLVESSFPSAPRLASRAREDFEFPTVGSGPAAGLRRMSDSTRAGPGYGASAAPTLVTARMAPSAPQLSSGPSEEDIWSPLSGCSNYFSPMTSLGGSVSASRIEGGPGWQPGEDVPPMAGQFSHRSHRSASLLETGDDRGPGDALLGPRAAKTPRRAPDAESPDPPDVPPGSLDKRPRQRDPSLALAEPLSSVAPQGTTDAPGKAQAPAPVSSQFQGFDPAPAPAAALSPSGLLAKPSSSFRFSYIPLPAVPSTLLPASVSDLPMYMSATAATPLPTWGRGQGEAEPPASPTPPASHMAPLAAAPAAGVSPALPAVVPMEGALRGPTSPAAAPSELPLRVPNGWEGRAVGGTSPSPRKDGGEEVGAAAAGAGIAALARPGEDMRRMPSIKDVRYLVPDESG